MSTFCLVRVTDIFYLNSRPSIVILWCKRTIDMKMFVVLVTCPLISVKSLFFWITFSVQLSHEDISELRGYFFHLVPKIVSGFDCGTTNPETSTSSSSSAVDESSFFPTPLLAWQQTSLFCTCDLPSLFYFAVSWLLFFLSMTAVLTYDYWHYFPCL